MSRTRETPAVLIVGINVTQTSEAVRRAEALGLKVYVADSPAKLAEHGELLTPATVPRPLDFEMADEVVALAAQISTESQLKGVIAFEEYALLGVAVANARFSLPGTSVETVRTTLSKFRTRQVLAAAGLPSIEFRLGHGIEDIYRFGDDHGYPLIIKPDNLKGSIGVFKIAVCGEVEDRFKRLAERVDPSNGFMIEEFLEGSEFSTEGIVHRGQVRIWSATEKILIPGTPVEGGHITPLAHPLIGAGFLQDYTTRICRALDVGFGPFHIESYIVGDRVIVGEVHTRYGGDQITTITQLSRGCDIHTPLFCEMAGIPHEFSIEEPRKQAGIFFLTPEPGLLRRVEVDDRFGLPDVVRHSITKKAGDLIGPIENSYDRAGWFIVAGSRREELLRKAETYRPMVRFDTGGNGTSPSLSTR